MKVLYSAAHAGFAHQRVPLGGGAAVSEALIAEWGRTQPFELHSLTPALLGHGAPSGRDIVRFTEREYARFCFAFQDAVTHEILRHDPADTVVLSNDVSEGPDFRLLSQRGFRTYTIYHVDVVAYVSAIYARGLVRPETLTRWFNAIESTPVRSLIPGIARLIFRKQRDSVECSRRLILPSESMRDVMLRCYPNLPPDRIHVLPWGVLPQPCGGLNPNSLRQEYGIPADALVLLTLSRISPEKGQDVLLKALYEWERRGDLPDQPLWLFLCGDAAFMMGQRFLDKLRALAGRLQKVRVIFPGHVTGERKRAFFQLADLYVFPSRHESYGLTLLEALNEGLPAVCLDHSGARSVMRDDFGAIVHSDAPAALLDAIKPLLADSDLRTRKGTAARKYAATQTFSAAASTLASILLTQ